MSGPSKTCRVPLLIGASNTGKSTLLYPFDDLFGPKHVFHKPALGSTFALRNIAKKKRFIFWDDFRPVEFAHKETIPVATFLSLSIYWEGHGDSGVAVFQRRQLGRKLEAGRCVHREGGWPLGAHHESHS